MLRLQWRILKLSDAWDVFGEAGDASKEYVWNYAALGLIPKGHRYISRVHVLSFRLVSLLESINLSGWNRFMVSVEIHQNYVQAPMV